MPSDEEIDEEIQKLRKEIEGMAKDPTEDNETDVGRIVRDNVNLIKSLTSGPRMSKAELDEMRGRSKTAGLTERQRRSNVKLAKKYLERLMDESENYMLYYSDVAMFLETMLIEGVFKDLKEPEQRKVASLFPENKTMVFYDIERVLRERGEKAGQEIFWRMVGEYKPVPHDPTKPTTYLYASD